MVVVVEARRGNRDLGPLPVAIQLRVFSGLPPALSLSFRPPSPLSRPHFSFILKSLADFSYFSTLFISPSRASLQF